MQIKLAALGLVAAVGGGTWWATAPSGEYYAMAPTEVASRLVSAQMPGEMSDTMPGRGDLQHRVYKTGNGQVIWEFTAVDTPVATFTADLEPDGNGTRVSVEFALADNEFGEAAARDVGEAREILTGLLEIAMEEHISATLEMRPFSDDNFGREAAKYALTSSRRRGCVRRQYAESNWSRSFQ